MVNNTAVIVGAGPAGCSAASLLAQRGWQVHVFERRAHLEPTGKSRGYPMALTSRALDCLELMGMQYDNDTRAVKSMYANGKEGMKRWTNDRKSLAVLVDRQQLGFDMQKAAAAQKFTSGGNITWHLDHALDDVDLKKQKATFAAGPSGQQAGEHVKTCVSYDLLVGADGYRSAVRAVLERDLPEMSCKTLLTTTKTYKTFSGLPVIPEVDQLVKNFRQEQPMQHVYFFNRPNGTNIVIWKLENNTVSGLLTGEQCFDEETLKSVVASYNLPAPWVPLIMEQIHETAQQPNKLGEVCRVSQIYGPHCVLLGDAGHPFTSGLGQGCNTALEDVQVFVQVLDKVGPDAVALEFNKARLPDVQAVQTLEYNFQKLVFNWGKEQNKVKLFVEKAYAFWLVGLSGIPWALAHKLLPSVFKASNFISHAFRDNSWSYSKILTALHAQSVLAVALGAGFVTAAFNLMSALVQLVKPLVLGA